VRLLDPDPRCQECRAKGAWEDEIIEVKDIVVSMLNVAVSRCFVCHRDL
jgi:hypothetical protein